MALGDSRRASGAAMEASRRAGGNAMIERRTGKSVVEDINSITAPPRQRKSLPNIDPVGALPARRGSGVYSAPAAGGGGISGPLTEVDDSRQYFAEKSLFYTADSLFAVEIQPLKQLMTVDGEENSLPINFKAPPTNV